MPNRYISKGIIFMFGATMLFSVMQVLVKYLNHIPVYELILFRAGISFVICFGTIKSQGISMLGNNKRLLLLRGLFGVASLSCFFYALQNAPLGSVVTIVNIKPLLILVVAMIWLKETVLPRQWLFFSISFLGILFMERFDSRIDPIELASIIGAAFFASIAHSIVRKLKETDKPIVILFYFTLITLPIAGPLSYYYWVTPVGLEWLILLSIGLITHFAQLLLTMAYQADKVANVSNMYYLGIVFAFGFGYLFFDEHYGVMSIVGMLLVLIGIFSNIFLVKKEA